MFAKELKYNLDYPCVELWEEKAENPEEQWQFLQWLFNEDWLWHPQQVGWMSEPILEPMLQLRKGRGCVWTPCPAQQNKMGPSTDLWLKCNCLWLGCSHVLWYGLELACSLLVNARCFQLGRLSSYEWRICVSDEGNNNKLTWGVELYLVWVLFN